MKIAILTRSLPFHRTGGLETHTWNLARGLARRDCKVFILTTSHPDGRPSDEIDGIRILYVPRTLPARYTPLFFSRLNREIVRLHSREKLDLIHSEGFAGLTLHPPLSLPMVATLHGTLFSETPLYPEYFKTCSLKEKIRYVWRYRWRILIRPLYRTYLERCERIFVDSRFSYNETIRDKAGVKKKLRVVPLGIDVADKHPPGREEARKRLGLPREEIILFTLSRLEKMKGVDVALEAIASLPRQNIMYLVGGEGRERAALENLATRKGLSNVKFLGRIPQEELSDYFAGADLFIYPEKSQPAFGLVSLESLSHGAPVLASRSGAIPEVVIPEVGVTFEPGNASDLALKLREMVSHISIWRSRSESLRQYVIQKFSLDRFIEDTLSVYHEVMEKK